MSHFRKKPVTIEAVQLRWTTWSEVCHLLGDALRKENPKGAWNIPAEEAADTCGEAGPNYIALNVRTVHGEIAVVRHGDWIIPEKAPERFYPCKPDIFEATYEPATLPTEALAALPPGGLAALVRRLVQALASDLCVEGLAEAFRDCKDEETVSLGTWSEPRPTMIPGIELPEFMARVRVTVGDLRRAAEALAAIPAPLRTAAPDAGTEET